MAIEKKEIKKSRVPWSQCDIHKAEDDVYGDYQWDRGNCPQCLEEKVRLLWEKVFVDKK
jgi:hypothetical protein